MAASIGVHFGSTSTCLSLSKDGKVDVIANDSGDRITPAVVAFTDHDQIIGLSAKQGLIRNSNNTVCHVKRFIGLNYHQIEANKSFASGNHVKVVNKDDHIFFEVNYKLKPKLISPSEISKVIFKKLLSIAHNHGNVESPYDVVVAVPIDFTPDQKDAFRQIINEAGFNLLRLIKEPVAAVLAYEIGQTLTDQSEHVLVVRIGGTSTDATVIKVISGMYQILGFSANHNLGGDDVTKILADHFANEFFRKTRSDFRDNKRSMIKLTNAAETCKHILSSRETAQCSIDSLFEGIDFQCNISRARFSGMISNKLNDFLEPIDKVIIQTDIDKSSIDQVVLSGGFTRTPSFYNLIKNTFSHSNILNSIEADEVIAIGAAKQASLHNVSESDEIKVNAELSILPCLSFDLRVEILNEANDSQLFTVLQKNTPIPCRRQHKFLVPDNHNSVKLRFFVSDATDSVAEIVIQKLTAGEILNSVFHCKSDGSIRITCQQNEISEDITIACHSHNKSAEILDS